ncbi:MAG: putative glycosyl transferase, group [Flavipsychrobacter sp.]|jgi:glycosyltransferase involved in cell wall biosynthesis|nr:putative glycosyl transferase, group [Flavipsychrobacter sp.]
MAGKQKIAFFCHPYHRGGVTRWMADAAIAYDKQGLEVYFVTVEPVKEFFSAKGRETLLQLLGKEPNAVKTITAKAGYEFEFGTPQYRAYIYKQLLVQLPAGTPIILSDDLAVWAAATALHRGYPIVGVMHADEAHYYKLAEQYYHSVAVLACVSHRVHHTVQKKVPAFNPSHIFTIPCGINLPPAGGSAAIHGDMLQLAYVGRVSIYQKRATDLAKICAALAKDGIRFHLSVIGDGDAKAPLEAAIKAEGLQQHVTFYGWLSQKEVAQHLSNTDILLLTSDFEGTPIAMMEAFAAGCGMVGTRVSGIEDYELHPLAPDCLGVYETGNIEEAVAKINRLAEVPAATRRHSARQLAEAEFSMEVCLERYAKAISTIAPVTTATTPEITLSLADKLRSRIIALARKLKTGQ